MDLRFTAADEAFRQEVRTFMRDNLPREIATDIRRWYNPRPEYYRPLATHPRRQGLGRAALAGAVGRHRLVAAAQAHIFGRALSRRAPDFGWQATHMVAPGDDRVRHAKQQARGSCRRSDAARNIWCQGFSEPGAGSDLANLQTDRRTRGR